MGRWGGERERVQEQWEKVLKHATEPVNWSPAVEQFLSYTPELGPILGAVGAMGGSAPGHIVSCVHSPTSIFGNTYELLCWEFPVVHGTHTG